jgi:hypothetical protein
MKGSRAYSLTALDVEITITAEALKGGSVKVSGFSDSKEKRQSAIIATDLTVTYRANDLAEASVSLGYTTKAGLAALQSIFPKGNEGALFGELVIKVKGIGGASYAPIKEREITLFDGLILGFSHSKGSQSIAFVVNAYSKIYPLTQIPVATPGFHPTSGLNLGVVNAIAASTFRGDGNSLGVARALLASASGVHTLYEVVQTLVTELLKKWSTALGNVPLPKGLRTAIKDWGLKQTAAVVQSLFDDNIVASSGGANVVITERNDEVLLDLCQTIWSNSSLTFWVFLISALDKYGVDLVCAGNGKGQLSVFDPLYPFAPAGNVIQPEDQTMVDIRDFPFDSPTRVIVTAPLPRTGGQGTTIGWRGVYPTTEDEVLPQEKATGVKTIVVEAPSYLSATAKLAALEVAKRGTIQKLRAGAKKSEAQLEEVRRLNIANQEKVALGSKEFNDYARYILMKQRFRQRTGSVVMRFDPSVLPGFVAKVIDPLGSKGKPISTVYGYVQEVTHTISSQGPMAQTAFTMSYVRYEGEVPIALTVNPLYPKADPRDDARLILVDMGVMTAKEASSQAAGEAAGAAGASAAAAAAASSSSASAAKSNARTAAATAVADFVSTAGAATGDIVADAAAEAAATAAAAAAVAEVLSDLGL